MPSGFDRGYVPVVHAGRDDRPDELDTINAAETVSQALGRLGYSSEVVRVGLDLSRLSQVAVRRPVCVFNLADAINGDDALIGLVPSVLEHLGVAFTGCGPSAFAETGSKIRTKRTLRHVGLPTAEWSEDGAGCDPAKRYIVKSDCQHGSLGMDANSVVYGDQVQREISARQARFGGRFFAEEFLDGREFNVALMGGESGVTVLPVQEINFDGFPEDRARIVDYSAKWDETDIAYHTTNRKFGLDACEPALAAKLIAISEKVWSVFSLRGYARVDFRVADGEPYVLEINANPAIAPDAGFAAAAGELGIHYDSLIEMIVDVAKSSHPRSGVPRADAVRQRSVIPSDFVESSLRWRRDVTKADILAITGLVQATGYFRDEETAIAAELVEERLSKGAASGYEFLIAELYGKIAGYSCFGKIDGTTDAFDLYWIAVDPALQGRGVGREVLRRSEAAMRELGAGRVYIDTSSSDKYRSTRAFYSAMGYAEQARLDDYYAKGDGKVIFTASLDEGTVGA